MGFDFLGDDPDADADAGAAADLRAFFEGRLGSADVSDLDWGFGSSSSLSPEEYAARSTLAARDGTPNLSVMGGGGVSDDREDLATLGGRI